MRSVGLLLLLVVAGCQRHAVPRKGIDDGHIIGNGGDPLQSTFAQGKRNARRVLERLGAAPLEELKIKGDGLTPSDIEQVNILSASLIPRIEESEHEWDTTLPAACPPAHTCGCTLSDKPRRVFLSYRNCRGTNSARQAAAVLIHEALHSLVNASEPAARALTATAMELWTAYGHPDAPHWKHVSLPDGFKEDLPFRSVLLNDEVIFLSYRKSAHYQPGKEQWRVRDLSVPVPLFDPIFDDHEVSGHDKRHIVEKRVVSIPNCYSQSILNGKAGYVYNPANARLDGISLSPLYSPRYRAVETSTGSDLFMWGGEHCNKTAANAHEWFDQGALYSPSRGWRAIDNRNAPQASRYTQAVAADNLVMLWGGTDVAGGGLYDPATNRWKGISLAHQPSPRIDFEMRATAKGILIYGGRCFHDPHDLANAPPCHKNDLHDGAIYDVKRDAWLPFNTPKGPNAGSGGVADGQFFLFRDGVKLYDFVWLQWKSLAVSPYSDTPLHEIHFLGSEYFAVFAGHGRAHAAVFYP